VILERDRGSAEGHFLAGLVARAAAQWAEAEQRFRTALAADPGRHDAAIEVADLCVRRQRNSEAVALLDRYRASLDNSPYYLGMAADAYARLDLHQRAWARYRRACELPPEGERFQEGLAASSTFLGKTDEARSIYESLLARHPNHQRWHHQLSRLVTARDFGHVDRMRAVLEATRLPPERNIFLYYALGKELEDLGAWDEAFHYYEKAGAAAKRASGYDVGTDLAIMEAVSSACDAAWLGSGGPVAHTDERGTPIFVVGLPRSGTTLVERIIASHSRVQSVGETFFLPAAIRSESRVAAAPGMTPEVVRAAAAAPAARIHARYFEAVQYKLDGRPMFVEKLPENWLWLGFIARSFPEARIVHVRRHPMDACFAMFKQSWFRFAYTVDDVGRYYLAYHRLMSHWRTVLNDRLTEIEYESLVTDQEGRTRALLDALGLEFEPACLRFEENAAPTRTASAVQVREKMHTRSVGRWKHFEHRLSDLRRYLEDHGIDVRNGGDD